MKSGKKREPVLIANRGEIAIRIARTCRRLGFPSVAIYSDADRFAEHVKACDFAYSLGGVTPGESYLNVDKILEIARRSKSKFVHPGYGFLSERSHFVNACEKAGLIFVGPSAQNMDVMGDKVEARKTVDSLKVPGIPGSPGAVPTADEAKKFAKQIGYPVLLKAKAGGGGKGMRRVDREEDIASSLEGASREAKQAFGDGAMYVEKLILKPHHVEIQVFGDGRGGAITLGERECSIQRRHQKVWEEAPSPILEKFPGTREEMIEASVKVASHIRYAGAGTFEFIVDEEGSFYFLEMNTRLQVEHPVSEWVTGVDLVEWQLLLAAGEFKLPKPPSMSGSAIEVRVYAEDSRRFLPAPGPMGEIHAPSGPFVRWDSAFETVGEVSMHYDPMIAKLSVWGADREAAVGRMRAALDELRVLPPIGIDGRAKGSLGTNIEFLKKLVRCKAVIKGDTTTDLIGAHPDLTAAPEGALTVEAAVATSLYQLLLESARYETKTSGQAESIWSSLAKREGVDRWPK